MTSEEKAIELVKQFQSCKDNGVSIDAAVMACLMEMVEWKEKQMIEKACKWIEDTYPNYIWSSVLSTKVSEDFRKTIEEQL